MMPGDVDPGAASDFMAAFRLAVESLPETVVVPRELTPEGQRRAHMAEICGDEFFDKIDRSKLANPTAFDIVANWDGSFPGPLAVGPTGRCKTRAAWVALGRLYVRDNRSFAWFPVKRLVSEIERYEAKSYGDEFYRYYAIFRKLFVDDIDKINWQFESQPAALFAFYDWVYRHHIPCITTTNKPREWWTEKMGDAFARRLFDDAHTCVNF